MYELSPAENFFAELLRFGQKLNDDDGRNDESVDHKDKSEQTYAVASAARFDVAKGVVAENCVAHSYPVYDRNDTDCKPNPKLFGG